MTTAYSVGCTSVNQESKLESKHLKLAGGSEPPVASRENVRLLTRQKASECVVLRAALCSARLGLLFWCLSTVTQHTLSIRTHILHKGPQSQLLLGEFLGNRGTAIKYSTTHICECLKPGLNRRRGSVASVGHRPVRRSREKGRRDGEDGRYSHSHYVEACAHR